VAEGDLVPRGGLQPSPFQHGAPPPAHTGPSSLADILERVLDKGIVIAGDIQINLLEIELLTIKLRLLIASVDRAREMGINWWESDPSLSSETKQLEEENQSLRERLERLEEKVGLPAAEDDGTKAGDEAPGRRRREKR
jgi:Gas vesicle protein